MIILGDKMKYFHEKNRIYVKENNDIIGEVSFTENKDGIIEITHTYVSFEYRGQHLASHLLEELSIRLEKEPFPADGSIIQSYSFKLITDKHFSTISFGV